MKAVNCETCGEWHHDKCIDITGSNFVLIKRKNITWKCNVCIENRNSPVKAVGTGLERQLASIADTLVKVLDRIEGLEAKATGTTEEVVEEMVTSKVDEAMEEAIRKIKNEKNLSVVNIPESTKESPKDREKDDREKMEVLLKKILPEVEKDDLKISDQFRLGEKTKSKRPRLIKLQMDNTSTKNKILKEYYTAINMREGKDVPLNDRIFINKDQTKKERETGIKMKEELHRRRVEGEKDIVIRGGRIITDEGRDDRRGHRGQFKDKNVTENKNEGRDDAVFEGAKGDRRKIDPTKEVSQEREKRMNQDNGNRHY